MDNKFTLRKLFGELALLFFTIVEMIPLYYFFISAFKTRKDIIEKPLLISAENFILTNFPYVIKRMKFFAALKNTGIMTLVSMVIVVIIASLAGFVVARIKCRAFSNYYKLMLACMVIPFIGCLIPLIQMTSQIGLYSSLWGVILIEAAWNLPFSTFLYTGFMGGIPKELEEAAYLDGCTTLGTYFRIFLPLLAPVTATCCIRNGVGIWNDFLVSNALLNAVQNPTLMVGIRSFFGKYVSEYGYAYAGVLLASLPMVILFVFLQRYFVKGITLGSVKG